MFSLTCIDKVLRMIDHDKDDLLKRNKRKEKKTVAIFGAPTTFRTPKHSFPPKNNLFINAGKAN